MPIGTSSKKYVEKWGEPGEISPFAEDKIYDYRNISFEGYQDVSLLCIFSPENKLKERWYRLSDVPKKEEYVKELSVRYNDLQNKLTAKFGNPASIENIDPLKRDIFESKKQYATEWNIGKETLYLRLTFHEKVWSDDDESISLSASYQESW